jgi:hypothetical protein
LRPAKVQFLGAQCASIPLQWGIATHCASMVHYEGMCRQETIAVILNFELA